MRKATKLWIIAAISLIVIGSAVFGGVMMALGWDFTKLSTVGYETNRYEINERYTDISVVTDTADVVLVPAEGSGSAVVCYEQENITHTVTVEDGTLVIEVADTRAWYERIGISFGTAKVTVYLPQGQYGSLSVKSETGNVEVPQVFSFESVRVAVNTGRVTCGACASGEMNIRTTTGDICVEDVSVGELTLSVSTGKVTALDVVCEGGMAVNVSTGKVILGNIACRSITSNGSTGRVQMENVVASQRLSVERSTGDIHLNRCDAATLFIKTDTGDVKGCLLTEKVFVASSDTGRVRVPASVGGGTCEISTDTGDIEITLA